MRTFDAHTRLARCPLHSDGLADGYPPYLLALAHYNWIERVRSVSSRRVDFELDAAGDLLDGRPVLNSVPANLRYEWPVPHITVYLLVFRDDNDQITFTKIHLHHTSLEPARTGKPEWTRCAATHHQKKQPSPALILQADDGCWKICARGAIF